MTFQIPLFNEPAAIQATWGNYDLTSSPFPDSGVNSRVLYTSHFVEGLEQINIWLQKFGQGPSVENCGVAPLALFGSLGVGKSHLLRFLEGGLNTSPRTPVLRVSLTEQGMERIILSDLLTKALPLAGESDLVHTICGSDSAKLRSVVERLDAGAPLRTPLLRITELLGVARTDAIETLSRWVRRLHTTPRRRTELGLSGPMSREGEALHVVANLCTVARELGIIDAWYVFIDQLEELWRPGVITATRRARLLTDLRLLADYALAGSPIALLMAWNTKFDAGSRTVDEMLVHDYRALWQRLPNPIDMPKLRNEDIWPFAERYLAVAGVTSTAKDRRADLFSKLHAKKDAVSKSLEEEEHNSYSARRVLQAWRDIAKELVEST